MKVSGDFGKLDAGKPYQKHPAGKTYQKHPAGKPYQKHPAGKPYQKHPPGKPYQKHPSMAQSETFNAVTQSQLAAEGRYNDLRPVLELDKDTIVYAQHDKTLEYLIKSGLDPRHEDSICLVIASKMGSIITCSTLLSAGVEPNDKSIIAAAEMGHDKVLALLLSYTNSLSVPIFSEESVDIALSKSVKYNHTRCVSALEEYKSRTY